MNFAIHRIVVSVVAAGVFACGLSAKEPERIVTLGASVTEIVFALGSGDQVVARDSSSMMPRAAQALPDVGYFRTIGAEGVLSLDPTLIVAAKDAGPDSQIDILKKSGIGFLHLNAAPSREAVMDNILKLGGFINQGKAAETLVKEIGSQFAEAQRISDQAEKAPKVIFLMSLTGNSARAAFQGTAADGIIKIAGGDNPYTGFMGYKTTSPEEVLAQDPDVILVSARHRGSNEDLDFTDPPSWLTATRAWKEGKAHKIDMSYYLVFGPRIGQAAVDLAELIHK